MFIFWIYFNYFLKPQQPKRLQKSTACLIAAEFSYLWFKTNIEFSLFSYFGHKNGLKSQNQGAHSDILWKYECWIRKDVNSLLASLEQNLALIF